MFIETSKYSLFNTHTTYRINFKLVFLFPNMCNLSVLCHHGYGTGFAMHTNFERMYHILFPQQIVMAIFCV